MGITEAKETIRACQFCFMCRYACPTFLATKLESVTPRGYALMLATIDRGQQAWSEDMVNRFYQCTLCGLCRAECEYNWPEDDPAMRQRKWRKRRQLFLNIVLLPGKRSKDCLLV
jgi:Fe-S oxidoreductase